MSAKGATASGYATGGGKGAGNRQSPWLNVWTDPVAGATAFSSCMALVDLDGTGDVRLALATSGEPNRLRVYRNATMVEETRLLDAPVAVRAYYPTLAMGGPRLPMLAVAAGPYVFVYRNMRAFFKWICPAVALHEREAAVWRGVRAGETAPAAAYAALSTARDEGVLLSSRAQDVLAQVTAEGVAGLVEQARSRPVVQQTCVTAMEVLHKSTTEATAPSCLVVATESAFVYVLKPDLRADSTNILCECRLPSVPVFMAVAGTYDVLYRITVACRDGAIYTIKNGELTSACIKLTTPCTGLARLGKNVWACTSDGWLHSYHVKGKRNFSVNLNSPGTGLAPMPLASTHGTGFLLCSTADGQIHTFRDKVKVDSLTGVGAVTGMIFGPYAREPSSLVVCTKGGTLWVKVLRRLAQLQGSDQTVGAPAEQDIPLPIPKTTRLSVEQTDRERRFAGDMHRMFQTDLCKLRLTTAKWFMDVITNGRGPQAYGHNALQLNVTLQGIGPKFHIRLALRCTSDRSVVGARAAVLHDSELYHVPRPLFPLQTLVPGVELVHTIAVEVREGQAGAADVRVVIVNPEDTSVAMLSATVAMPFCDASVPEEE